MNNNIKTRFAPSPTGKLHIGGVRTALFAWLFAQKNNGKFYIRIEDTDRERLDKEGIPMITESLGWLGIDWDEGINSQGESIGEFGPYIQSQRLDIYKKHIQALLDSGEAYYCFCSSERLEQLRKKQEENKQPPMYDRKCLKLSESEIKEKIDNGEKYVIRFKIPENGKTILEDLVYGKIEFENNLLDDIVLMKSDRFPTYHFAHIVDDHLMKTSHVLRGEEWISSTPKHILLFKAFGWEPPQYVHLPLILGPDKKKLSKRHGSTKIPDFRDRGYLPEALINYIAFLGWNPKTTQEMFSLKELIENFDLSKINKTAPIFSYEKLDWFNVQYLKVLSLSDLSERCLTFVGIYLKNLESRIKNRELENDDIGYIEKIVTVERERIKKLADITENIDFFLFEEIEYPVELLIWKDVTHEKIKNNLEKLLEIIEKIDEKNWTVENLEKQIMPKAEKADGGRGGMLWPMRAALTGTKKSPSPFEVAWVLGKKVTMKRMDDAVAILTEQISKSK
ncbi:glutamate--tRNA ligase [bacterium]|nr:MAG: glutamate--tRNA ligase [bacterium]